MQRWTDDLWTEDRSLHVLGANLGTRMTVARVGDGLLLHSPIAIDDGLAREIDALGPVRWLVAPSSLHHLFLASAKARYPEAEVIAAPGVEKKVSIPVDRSLADAPPAAWDGVIETHFIAGMPKLNEVALLHRPSGTLMLTDFMFNFPARPGWWDRTFLKMAGAYGGPAQSRLLRSLMADKDAVRRSRDALLGWAFDRVTLCHGDVVPTAGKDALASATAWM